MMGGYVGLQYGIPPTSYSRDTRDREQKQQGLETHVDVPHERPPIHLSHPLLVQIRRDTVSPVLPVIGHEMLCAGLHTSALDANDGFVGAFAVEERVRTEALPTAPRLWIAHLRTQ